MSEATAEAVCTRCMTGVYPYVSKHVMRRERERLKRRCVVSGSG